jgi:membrane protein
VPGAAARRFIDHGMLERAASLAFYGLLSLIPVLLIAAAGFKALGSPDAIADAQQAARDAGASQSVTGVLKGILDTAISAAPEQAGSAGLIGLVTLLYGSSKIFTDAGRALDQIRGARRVRRPLLKRATDLGWTVALVVCGLTLAVLIFVTGNLVQGLLDKIGLDDVSSGFWNLARWPIAIAIAVLAYELVTWAGPTGARRPFRLVTPGALVACGLWLTASLGYTIYLSNFSHYNATYGAFAAIIILMLWLWFTCVVFLYGAELDAELDARHEGIGYEIRIDGRLSDSAGTALEDLTTTVEPTATVLHCKVSDMAELRGVLEQIESLGLEPTEIRRAASEG